MTKRTLNTHELEIIAGGATEVSEEGHATSKSDSVMKGSDSSSGNSGAGGVDTQNVQQNQDLPAA